MGDAAHPMMTTLAQGACQAIEDAGVLGSSLRAAPDIQGLRTYEQARMRRATMIARQSGWWERSSSGILLRALGHAICC